MRKGLALAALLAAAAAPGLMPGLILGRTERYQVSAPRTVSYRPSVRCQGTVYPKEGYQLLAASVYRVEERYVSLGDRVEKGEALALLGPVGDDPILYLQTQGSGLSGLEDGGGLLALAQGSGLDASLLEGAGGYQAVRRILRNTAEGEGSVLATAPVAGVVTKEPPAQGSVVQAGSALCAVEGGGEYFALLSVGERDAYQLEAGDEVILSGEGVGLVSCPGVVSKIYPGTRKELSGTAVQNVVDVEVEIQPDYQEIRPGFTVKAQVFTDVERVVTVVPYESVRQDEDNQEYVLVAAEGRLEKRPITTGLEMTDGVEVVEGVAAWELIATPKEGPGEEPPARYLLERKED